MTPETVLSRHANAIQKQMQHLAAECASVYGCEKVAKSS